MSNEVPYTSRKPVVFIHGAWMTPACWDPFTTVFEAAEYRVLAPAWPFIDGPAAALRSHPPAGLGGMTVGTIVDHYARIINTLPVPPLIIGHSFGGLVAQLLLDRGIGRAGVAVAPAPFAGIVPDGTTLAGALPILLRWNGWNRPYTISRQHFAMNFANTMDAASQQAAFERLVVPTSGRIFYQAATGIGLVIHPKERLQPLLIIEGEMDRTVTPSMARTAFEKQRKSPSRTDFKQFAGRSHFILSEPGWEEVADYALNWAENLV